MNKNGGLYWAAAVASVLVLSLLGLWFRFLADSNFTRQKVSTPAAPPAPGAQATQSKEVAKGFTALFEHLQQAGARLVPSVADELSNAVAGGDRGTILRAFGDAIESHYNQREEAIQALRLFTNAGSPFVRVQAAQALLRVGDLSGVPALLALVNTPGAVIDGGTDLRQQAVHQLLKYRIKEAIPSGVALFSRAPKISLIDDLAANGQAIAEADSAPYTSSWSACEEYAKLGITKFTPNMARSFQRTSDPEVKNAAAWALARLNRDPAYVDFLVQAARPAIESPEQLSMSAEGNSAEALRYLGSLDDPAARQTLERALDSANSTAVEIALINLLFNQREPSAKARAVLLREIDTPVGGKVSFTLLLKIAAARLDDPDVRAAAVRADARGSDRLWTHYAFRRAQWPIFQLTQGLERGGIVACLQGLARVPVERQKIIRIGLADAFRELPPALGVGRGDKLRGQGVEEFPRRFGRCSRQSAGREPSSG